MKREIKFRTWDEQYKQFWKVFFIHSMFGSVNYMDMSKDWIPNQFTGLKDKNGKEIYEGDIAIFGSDPAEQIIFKSGAFRWGGDFDYILQISEEYETEVIGNIYENPELLKGGVEVV